MFVDSLNDTLKGEIQNRIPDEPSFLEVWMLFIQTLQTNSMERFKDMEKEVRSLQPQQFSGQNITEMCLSIFKHCKGLTAAGVYDHQLNSKIIQNLLLTDGNDQYKFTLLQQQEKLNKALQAVRFMTKIEANEYLISRQLTFGDICCLAEDRYRQALGDNSWGPASNLKDSKTPPGAFSYAQLNALIEQFQGKQQRDKSNDIWHHCVQKGHWANECPNRANVTRPIANRGRDCNNVRRPGRGGPAHRCPPLQAGRCGGGRGHQGRVGHTGARDYAPWRLVAPMNLEEQKYVNGRWFKFDPAASPPRWNVVRPTAQANNQANILEFDPAAWMTEVPDYQAWTNVINSVPTYSNMGTSPAIASSPLINPRPLVETVEDEEENTVGELTAAAELANETLTAPSTTTNLPTSPSITTAHVLSKRHHQRPSHRACQDALSTNNELKIVLLNSPACSNRDPLDGTLSGPPSATAFRSACVTHRSTHIGPSTSRTSPQVFRTPWRPSAPTSTRISHSEPPQNLLWPSRPHLPSAHYFGSQPSTISWLVVGYGVKRATLDVPSTSGSCPLGSMGPVLSVPGLPGPSSRGIMDLGRLPGWESVSFFRTVLPQ